MTTNQWSTWEDPHKFSFQNTSTWRVVRETDSRYLQKRQDGGFPKLHEIGDHLGHLVVVRRGQRSELDHRQKGADLPPSAVKKTPPPTSKKRIKIRDPRDLVLSSFQHGTFTRNVIFVWRRTGSTRVEECRCKTSKEQRALKRKRDICFF